MKIHRMTEFPKAATEDFSETVLTCDKNELTNLAFYNFDTDEWSFLSETEDDYKGTEFVWIYPPSQKMKEFLIKSINENRTSTTASSKENWYKKKAKHRKKKNAHAFKKK